MEEKLTKFQKLDILHGVFEEVVNTKNTVTRFVRGQQYLIGLASFPVRREEEEGHGVVGTRQSDGSVVTFYCESEVSELNFPNVVLVAPMFEISVSEVDDQFEYVNHPVKARNLRSWNAARILSSTIFKRFETDLKMYAQTLC